MIKVVANLLVRDLNNPDSESSDASDILYKASCSCRQALLPSGLVERLFVTLLHRFTFHDLGNVTFEDRKIGILFLPSLAENKRYPPPHTESVPRLRDIFRESNRR